MKKSKKTNKKRSNHSNSFYTPNYNVFGERAETHLVMLKTETALEQLVDIFVRVMDNKTPIEYTIGWSDYDGPAKQDELYEQAMAIASMMVSMKRSANNGRWVA